LPQARRKLFGIKKNCPIYPIFDEEFSFREELAARNGDFPRQTLRANVDHDRLRSAARLRSVVGLLLLS
jgi:hypothetical protein